ncbi:hypothetical protein M407DRAFT_25051 [Tulasnella calospora MUT 4182]|uniref:Uncharacterized protein n=1 Tax=Tulasnella calospora MUT 4182 TaxID=1051891 RepID=A0A0C3QGP5_9AGAM|nr:hypothetical protein M407DRAFT_25051 [Tulasnella calospora MUT 4182]
MSSSVKLREQPSTVRLSLLDLIGPIVTLGGFFPVTQPLIAEFGADTTMGLIYSVVFDQETPLYKQTPEENFHTFANFSSLLLAFSFPDRFDVGQAASAYAIKKYGIDSIARRLIELASGSLRSLHASGTSTALLTRLLVTPQANIKFFQKFGLHIYQVRGCWTSFESSLKSGDEVNAGRAIDTMLLFLTGLFNRLPKSQGPLGRRIILDLLDGEDLLVALALYLKNGTLDSELWKFVIHPVLPTDNRSFFLSAWGRAFDHTCGGDHFCYPGPARFRPDAKFKHQIHMEINRNLSEYKAQPLQGDLRA